MNNKYIIELESAYYTDPGRTPDVLFKVKGFKSLVFDMEGVKKLEPYKPCKVKKARWYRAGRYMECSECGDLEVETLPNSMKYCPNCGAAMEEE